MSQRKYIDFKLYLTGAPDGGCQVSLLPTPEVGESVAPVIVKAEKGPTIDLLPYIAQKQISLPKLVAFGKQLANWLLPDEAAVEGQSTIRDLFVEAVKRAGNEGGVRLRLIIADPELKKWPWEYTYFKPLGVGGPDSMGGFLGLNPRFSIVRHEPLPHPHPLPKTSEADVTDLRLVIAAASPVDPKVPELKVDEEVTHITDALKEIRVDGTKITSVPILDATQPEVETALRGTGSAYIFHFAGHGISQFTPMDPMDPTKTREEGFLLFLKDKGTKAVKSWRAEDLAGKLQAAGVRLAVFGACYSGKRSERNPWDSVAGALAAADIPTIITMQYEVIEAHAIEFTKAFYGALAAGLSLDEAMSAGRSAMYGLNSEKYSEKGSLEWGVPVLYSRLPDGQLFPERMERAGATAQQMRTVIQQTADTITETGRVVGIQGKVVNGNYEIIQNAGNVDGTMIGIEVDRIDGSASVNQTAKDVSGNMTGIKL